MPSEHITQQLSVAAAIAAAIAVGMWIYYQRRKHEQRMYGMCYSLAGASKAIRSMLEASDPPEKAVTTLAQHSKFENALVAVERFAIPEYAAYAFVMDEDGREWANGTFALTKRPTRVLSTVDVEVDGGKERPVAELIRVAQCTGCGFAYYTWYTPPNAACDGPADTAVRKVAYVCRLRGGPFFVAVCAPVRS